MFDLSITNTGCWWKNRDKRNLNWEAAKKRNYYLPVSINKDIQGKRELI
jgi:hypothetical protein